MAYTVKAGTHDTLRVNIDDDYDVRYWARRLGVTSETLKAAISKIGPMVKDLECEVKRAQSEQSVLDRKESEHNRPSELVPRTNSRIGTDPVPI